MSRGGDKPVPALWRRSDAKYPSMRLGVAEGEHPVHGTFDLGMCTFTGTWWVGITGDDGKTKFYTTTANQVMEHFFAALEAGDIDIPSPKGREAKRPPLVFADPRAAGSAARGFFEGQ